MARLILTAALVIGCAATPALAADNAQPAPKTDAQGNGTLSDKLSTTGGVIHPSENVDPAIATAPPASGAKTPVIPPPGSPGGNQSVQPK
jgi:hypothetical protein